MCDYDCKYIGLIITLVGIYKKYPTNPYIFLSITLIINNYSPTLPPRVQRPLTLPMHRDTKLRGNICCTSYIFIGRSYLPDPPHITKDLLKYPPPP